MRNKVITLADLRRSVDRALQQEKRAPVNDVVWQYAQDQRWFDPADPGAADIDELVVNIVEARRVFGFDRKVEPVRIERGVPAARKYAISLLLAHEARARADVTIFRDNHLQGKPIRIEEVEAWVIQRAITEGPPTQFADGVALPPSAKPDPTSGDLGLDRVPAKGELRAESFRWKILIYPKPDLSLGYAHVAVGGALHDLYQLAARLANHFHWSEVEALTFLLTDLVPRVEPVLYRPRWSSLPCLSRITLTLDPALSPRQVEGIYRHARGQTLLGRYRNLSQKHALLAAFTATPSVAELSDQMRKWNAQYPRWRYKLVTNFGRDAKVARERLLAPSNLSLKAMLDRRPDKTQTR